MEQADIRLFNAPIKLFDVPDDSRRRALHGIFTDCLQRLLPPLFVSGNANGHEFNVRTETGLGIQLRLPARAPCDASLFFGWNTDTPPEGFADVLENVIREIRATLDTGPVAFAARAAMDIGTNRILALHRLSEDVALAGAVKTHRIDLATVHEHGSNTLSRYSQDFQAVFPVTATSTAEAGLIASRPAAELALFLTVLLRYPIYRGQIAAAPSGNVLSALPDGYDLRDGLQFETHIVRPDLTDHDSIWMTDQLIYPDPTPYPGDATLLFQVLSGLTEEKKQRFFLAVHAYRLALRLLIREFLRGFLPEQSYSIALFQTALEALASPNDRNHLMSTIRKRTPTIFGHYRASPLADADRLRNPVLHKGQLFGGEMGPDPHTQMLAGARINSDEFFRKEAAKAETTTAAVIIDWLSHGGA